MGFCSASDAVSSRGRLLNFYLEGGKTRGRLKLELEGSNGRTSWEGRRLFFVVEGVMLSVFTSDARAIMVLC